MSKYIAESFYTCLFKITHNLQELTNEALQEIDSRKDGKVEVLDVKFNKRKTKSLAEIQANKTQSKEQELKEISSQKISEDITSTIFNNLKDNKTSSIENKAFSERRKMPDRRKGYIQKAMIGCFLWCHVSLVTPVATVSVMRAVARAAGVEIS